MSAPDRGPYRMKRMQDSLLVAVILGVAVVPFALAEDKPNPEERKLFKVAGVLKMPPDRWKPKQVEYDVKWIGNPSHGDGYAKALLDKEALQKLKGKTLGKTILTLKDEEDKKYLRDLLGIKDSSRDTFTTFVLTTALRKAASAAVGALAPEIIVPFKVGLFTLGVLKSLPDEVKETKEDLRPLIAKDGEVRYAESMSDASPWILTRVISYCVKVGSEDRAVVLYAVTMPAEAK